MADLRVTCIRKRDRLSKNEGITHLGGTWGLWSRQDVINAIRNKQHTFYTFEAGNRGDIGVVDDPDGAYLRTYADGKWNDNLLSLREC